MKMPVTEQQMNAMAAIFDLCEAIDSGLTVADLVEVMRFSVKDGADLRCICLTMARFAAGEFAKQTAQ